MRVGVDEAGKGPALGSMFAAAVAGPATALPDGVDDSKRLPPARREELAERLRADDRVAVGVAEIPVERIDDPDSDMNGLTVAAHAEAIAALDGTKPSSDDDVAGGSVPVIADAGDVDADRFARRVADRLPDGDGTRFDIRAEHGADDEHDHVAAASVIAKVERDAHVAALDAGYDRPIGSGYPGDPTTREFLAAYVEEHGELPACARSSWGTCEDALAAAAQSGLDEF